MSTTTSDTLPPGFGRPHVFILGAGASRAAFPNGDCAGRTVPLMNDLIDVLDLEPLFDEYGIEPREGDFEALYSKFATSNEHPDFMQELEHRLFDYFARMRLPDKPTLYDHLVLSLRPKDLIATFNWDPFLWDALCRNGAFAPMPKSVFLHGSVAVGYCTKHEPVTLGRRRKRCGRCNGLLEPSRLIYPVTEKNYDTDDPRIAMSWRDFGRFLKNAFIVTIYGYRAPMSDVKAVSLMKDAWGDAEQRELEQIEIINTAAPEDLEETWEPFFCREHYFLHRSFYDSLAATHPRRSCEDFWEAIMECNPQPDRVIPRDSDWNGLREWFKPLVDQELGAAVE